VVVVDNTLRKSQTIALYIQLYIRDKIFSQQRGFYKHFDFKETRFCVQYSDKTWLFSQLMRARTCSVRSAS